MFKLAALRSYPLRFLFILLGLGAASTLTYVMVFNFDLPFGLTMLLLFLSACIILFIDFRKSNRAPLYKFVLRLILALIIGFIIFFHFSLWVKVVITVYSLVLLSVLSYATTDMFHKISILCLVMFGFNLVIGLLDYNTVIFVDYGRIFSIMTVVSTIAILSFFIILNVDAARWFGSDGLGIPGTMKRTSFMVLVVVSMFIAILSLSPWLVEAGRVLFNSIFGLISSFFSFLFGLISNGPQEMYMPPLEEQGQNGFPIFDLYEPLEESNGADPFLVQLIIGIIIAVFLSFIGFIFFILIRYALRLFGSWQQNISPENEVFTEIIEKITSERKKQKNKGAVKRPGYLSLKTDRERIIFIYREYVKRAKRNGLTADNIFDTPNDILNEIAQKADGSNFPLPEELKDTFSIARYGNENIEFTNIYELKQKLL